MLLPETKLLLGEYGNAAFDLGNINDDDPEGQAHIVAASERMVRAKETLLHHLETYYTPTPKA